MKKKKIKKPENTLAKNIGKKVFAKFSAVIKERDNGMLRAIVNSGKKDRHGEVLEIKGLNIKEYMKNPVLANSHDYSKPSVGRTFRLIKDKLGQLVADFKFATDIPEYPEPRILDGLYRKGWQFAFSIGFIPQEEDGNSYTKSTMIEFSPVLIPADGNALLMAKKMGYEDGDDPVTIAKKLGLDKEIDEDYHYSMDIKELLKKLFEKGKEALTANEIKFIQSKQDDLTLAEVKKVEKALKDVKPADDKSDDTEKALAELKDKIETQAKEIEAMKKATVAKKDINGQHTVTLKKDKPSKAVKFLHYVRGLQSGDFKSYLNIVGKDAMNTGDDGVVLPPQEFVLEIERLEEEVGVAERFANVRRSSVGAGIKYVMGDDDLEIFDTAESGVKKSTRLTYKQLLLAWRKFAGILPITDELTEDSAVDLWNDATNRFARAYAKKGDQLVFTNQASGGNTKNGVLYVAGTKLVTAAGDAFTDITWEDLSDMIYGVPTQSASGGRFFLNREALGIISKMKDDEHRPLWLPSVAEGVPATILGKPYTETEVLPKIAEEEAGLPVMCFGDLRYATLGMRTDLSIKIFDTGLVGDPDEEDQDENQINLMTQDVQAMRAVKRMNAVVRFPEAFSVLRLGGNS